MDDSADRDRGRARRGRSVLLAAAPVAYLVLAAGLAVVAITIFRVGGFDPVAASGLVGFGALRLVLAAIGTWRDDGSGAEHAVAVFWFGCWFSAVVAGTLFVSRVVFPLLDGHEVGEAGVGVAALAGLSVVCLGVCHLVPVPGARTGSGAAPRPEPRPAAEPLIDVPDGNTPSATVLGLAQSRGFGAFREVAVSRRTGGETIFQFERGRVVRGRDGRLEAGPVSVGSVREVVDAVESGRRVSFGEIGIDADGIIASNWRAAWTEVMGLEARGSGIVVERASRTERAGSRTRPITDAAVLAEAADVLVRRARTMR
jgi:hypothetical protein